MNRNHALLIDLRKELHRFPELSGIEEMTSKRITGFLKELGPDQIIEGLGGKGVAARFRGGRPGPRVMVRAELDALPVRESAISDHSSQIPGISHACGHDGHMAIAAGVALDFTEQRHDRGELVVLFQPSEENGRGAFDVINDPQFSTITPDFALALHNLPGFALNSVILRKGVFAAASTGMIIQLSGKTSHAGEPENGVSPVPAVSRILKELPLLAESDELGGFALATIIHAKIGEVAFGTSPGEAVVMATLRAFDNDDMDKLISMAGSLVHEIAHDGKLEIEVSVTEKFPATENDDFLTGMVGKAGQELGYKLHYIENPFRWSEDFAWFTRKYRGILFGIGSGENYPDLHNPDYDFPDELIEPGVNIMTAACRKLLNTE